VLPFHSNTDTQPELENTGTRIESDFVPEHADLIQGQRKKQKRLERRLKRGILMVAGWALNAAMVYLILVTARTTPDIWDPYDVLGVSRVCTMVLGELCTGN
jgi:translocation protein SEC63